MGLVHLYLASEFCRCIRNDHRAEGTAAYRTMDPGTLVNRRCGLFQDIQPPPSEVCLDSVCGEGFDNRKPSVKESAVSRDRESGNIPRSSARNETYKPSR